MMSFELVQGLQIMRRCPGASHDYGWTTCILVQCYARSKAEAGSHSCKQRPRPLLGMGKCLFSL